MTAAAAGIADAVERMIQIEMDAYPASWTDAERREAARDHLFVREA